MATLETVKSWMTFFGWSDGGSPGSVKRGADGEIIATWGDKTYHADLEEACAVSERRAIVEELERRERERNGRSSMLEA